MTSAPIILPRNFYDRPTLTVAQDLLGKVLVRHHPDFGPLKARIVETEAYIGGEDKACHASKGMTERTKIMFGEPGHAYVYLIYGMYDCLNLVTEAEGIPAAVLIRAAEPIEGAEAMKALRGDKARKPYDLTSGPGKLCKAMNITRALNGADICGESPLYVEDALPQKLKIISCPRIGVDYAGEYKDRPWRFYIKGNPYVSKKAPDQYL